MENQNNNLNTQPTETVMKIKPRRMWWKYALGIVAIVVFVLGGYMVWSQYFSSAAKYSREVEKSALALPAKIEAYKKAMEADVYGGKTPEETLQLFIDDLKKGDVELASKYFALDNDTARPDLSRLDNFKVMVKEDKLQGMIDLLLKAKPAGSSLEGYYGFYIRDENGELIADIDLVFNKYSGVWKIESL